MMTSILFSEVVELAVSLEPSELEGHVRDSLERTTDSVRELLIEAASTLSPQAFSFAYKYVDYYLATRGSNIIPQQFQWTTKYAIFIAPVASLLLTDQEFDSGFVGENVEYSFASVRLSTQPDAADYDIHVLYGAIILRLLKQYGIDSEMAREIGASWAAVVEHWDHLQNRDGAYVQSFVRNLTSGGAVALSDGLL